MAIGQLPAGWYEDPRTKARRYWDGAAWLDGQGVAEATPPTRPGLATPQTNTLAVVSFVLSLVGPFLCGVGSVVALILALVALDQIKRADGWQTGKGLAVAAVVLGGIVTVVIAGWMVLMVVGLIMGGGSS